MLPAGRLPPPRRGMFCVRADGPAPDGERARLVGLGRTQVRPRWGVITCSLGRRKGDGRCGEVADATLTLCLV